MKVDCIFDFLDNQQKQLENEIAVRHGQLEFDHLPIGIGQCAYVHNYQLQKITFKKGIEDLLGYEDDEFTSELIHSYFHPDDVEMINKLLQAIITYARNTDFRNQQGFFYLSYRIKKKDGSYLKVLRQSYVYEITEEGKLLSNLSVLTDITAFDNTNVVNWDFKSEGVDIEKFRKIVGEQYLKYFSQREIEIIRAINSGLSSKETGLQLNISSHTVDTHRRKILSKSNCKNTLELLAFCRKNGIL